MFGFESIQLQAGLNGGDRSAKTGRARSKSTLFGLKIKYLFAHINLLLFMKTSYDHVKNVFISKLSVKNFFKKKKLIGC